MTVVNRLDIPIDYKTPLTPGQWVARDALFGVAAFCLLVPGVFGPQSHGGVRRFLRLRPVQWLGMVSYGVYLWHEAAIDLYQHWTHTRFFTGAFPLFSQSVSESFVRSFVRSFRRSFGRLFRCC